MNKMEEKQELNEAIKVLEEFMMQLNQEEKEAAMIASRTSDKTGKAFAELMSKINRINGEN